MPTIRHLQYPAGDGVSASGKSVLTEEDSGYVALAQFNVCSVHYVVSTYNNISRLPLFVLILQITFWKTIIHPRSVQVTLCSI